MARILCVMAHPDDETFWCGAALASHALNGDQGCVLILSDGCGSRAEGTHRWDAFQSACAHLGVVGRYARAFPDQQADTVSQLSINQHVEASVALMKPSRVYTHFVGDLNPDHRHVAEAVLVATRGICPVWLARPDELGRALWPFRPDHRRRVTVEPVRAQKLAAVRCYPTELRPSGVRSVAYFQAEQYEEFEVRT